MLGGLSGKNPAWIESVIWDDYYTGRSPAYLFDLGRITAKEFAAKLRELFGINAGVSDAQILDPFNCHFYFGREMWQMLHYIKENTDCIMGVVSNNNCWQWPYTLRTFPTLGLRNKGKGGIMDFHIVSHLERVVKPDRRIWERSLEESRAGQMRRFGISYLQPDECAFFDNSQRNVDAAKEFGVRAFLVDISGGYGGIRRDLETIGFEMPTPLWKPRYVREYLERLHGSKS